MARTRWPAVKNRWQAALVMLTLLLSGARARAEHDLGWQAPAGCPGPAAVQARLRDLLAEKGSAQQVPVDVLVDTAPTGSLRARVVARDGSAQRELYAEGCEALVEGVLLVLALSFAEPVTSSPVVDTAPPSLPDREVARQSLSRDVAPEPRERPAVGAALTFSVLTRVDAGSLPTATPALGGSLGWTRPRLLLELEAAHHFRQGVNLPRGVAGQASFALTSLLARVCFALRGDFLELRPGVRWRGCLAGELGRLSARSRGLEQARSQHALTSALWLGTGATLVTRSRFHPWLNLEAGLPLLRPSFDVASHGSLFQPSRVAGRATLGLTALFR